MNLTFGHIEYLALLLLVPLLMWLIFSFLKWKKSKEMAFADERFHDYLFAKKSGFIRFVPWAYLLSIVFLILSLANLVSGKEEIETTQKMNNVLFLLDVSSSMNAEDVSPSRLDKAKNVLIETMTSLQNDRVGLIVFAGEATSIMPLTTDYTALETYISAIETDMMKIQGTDFLKAVQEAVKKFASVSKGSRTIVLISDGEDNEGNAGKAIELAKKEGITILTVGVGTEEGAPVPVYILGQLMGYKTSGFGETVISKRQDEALKEIASSTQGTYMQGTMDDLPQQIVYAIAEGKSSSRNFVKSQNAIHYYQYFLGVSLFILFLVYLLNPKRDVNL